MFQNRKELKYASFLIYTLLVGAILAVYWQVSHFEFISFDDIKYITKNDVVKEGLTLHGISWAFTHFHASNWHPLTWLSHMLDVQLFGMNPGAHHMVNVLLHTLNTLLLYIVLRNMTGSHWRSALVAALFALHPLHVESVAWVSERKDVLSTFFWMLTIFFYHRYTQRPSVYRYLLVFMAMALGLMSKPMLVTLPFVLLLLDYWPLSKTRIEIPFADYNKVAAIWHLRLFLEKLPLFMLSAASATITFYAQNSGGAVSDFQKLDIVSRLSNTIFSYGMYIWKFIIPIDLVVFYPLTTAPPIAATLGFAIAIVMMTFGAVKLGRQYPYLPVGWFWYLGTLVPVIGFVQVGAQAMADRYTYVPLIGIFIIVSWGVSDLCSRRTNLRRLAIAIMVFTVTAFAATAWVQAGYWRNTMTLFRHAEAVTGSNQITRTNIAIARAQPRSAEEYYRYGLIFADKGKIDQAIEHFEMALALNPDLEEVHEDLGMAYAQIGENAQAISHLQAALALKPDDQSLRDNLAHILAQERKQ